MFQGKEYIYKVFKEQSFSKAAKEMYISQPSLSASVRRVEEKVGAPLFDRSTKPLSLTECGEKYIEAVEKMMAAEEEFREYISDWEGLKTGTLTVGGSSLFSALVLPSLIRQFQERFPAVTIRLVEENSAVLREMLQDGRIDLMLDNCARQPDMFDDKLYREEHLLLAVPAVNPVNEKLREYEITREQLLAPDGMPPAVPMDEFRGEQFILLRPANDTRERAEAVLKANGLKPSVLFELDQQMTAFHVTCSGAGISFVSDTLILASAQMGDVCFYRLPEKYSRRMIRFFWKKGRYVSRIMQEFLAICDQS